MRIATSGLLVLLLGLLLGASAFLPSPSQSPRHRPAMPMTRMQAAAAPDAPAATTSSSPLLQQLQAAFPRVSIPFEFVQGIAVSDGGSGAGSGSEAQEQQALVRARTLASLAPRVLLARGLDTIAGDFGYFSPSTGLLARNEYMGLVALLERALPDLRLTSAHFQVVASRPGTGGGGGGAVVSFLSRAQGVFTGELCLGEMVVPGTGARYKGDVELNLVAFDPEGLLQAFSTGLVVGEDTLAGLPADARDALGVAGAHGAADGEEEEEGEVGELRRRLESQTQKLSTTPEGTAAWEKIKADVAAVQHKLDTFQREGEMARTGGGHGGLGGVLYALGVEHHGGVVALDGVAGVAEELLDDDIAMELDFVSVPSECETLLRETQAAWGDAMASSGSSSSS